MATVTAETIVKRASTKAGNSSASAENKTDALIDLNAMIGQWGIEGLLVPSLTTENFTLTINDGEYSIGSGGDFDTVRPIEIVSAYLQDADGYDHPLNVRNMTKEVYNSITDKTTKAQPERLLYVQSYPLGKIYFDYLPDIAYTFYLDSFKPLTEFTALTSTVNLPDEYKMALIYNLALLIADDLGNQPSKITVGLAVDTKRILKRNNIQTPLAEIDNALLGGSRFNIYTGQYTS